MEVNLGGVVPLSTVDWFGVAATVFFLRGCPLRCPHCQNSHLQTGETPEKLSVVNEKIQEAAPFVNAVVLSGGEALMQPSAVEEMVRFARELSLKVGIETCGYYPDRLADLVEKGLVDKVFLDVKAALRDPEYARATGRENVASRVKESLEKCLDQGVPLEVRTTIFPEMPSSGELREIAGYLSMRGIEVLVLQQGLPKKNEFEPLSKERLDELASSIEDLIKVSVRAPESLG